MKKLFFIIIIIIPLLSACKKDPDPEPVDEYTFDERARDGLYELMDFLYLWEDKIPTLKVSDYDSPEELLEKMRYLPKDKWSFVADYDAFMASMQGTFVGHGIRMGVDPSRNVRVVSLYKNSDMWPKGVRRGWIIKKVNGVDFAPLFTGSDAAAYNALMGPSTAGHVNTFTFIKPDATEVTISSTKASFTINSVTTDTVFDRGARKIAYLAFETFIEPSEDELNAAFAKFKTKGATDLIIDLRYNGGGYMSIAQQLASLVVDNTYTSKVCYTLKYNSTAASEWNESNNFTETTSPLGLDKVVFITTRSSASASEVVINSLLPWIDVTIVGDTTHGKPAGMNLFGYPFPSNANPNPDYKYVFAPITFEYVNSANAGGFYEGMLPDVKANDDITRDFGDTNELSLKAALAVIEGTGTKGASAEPFRRTRIFSEGNQLPQTLILDSPKTFKK